MEACYAEGSKSRSDAVPQISLRPLAHQNCIRRDRIVAVVPTNSDSGQSFGLEPISKLFEEDNKAGKLDKAKEIVGVVLPANEDPALPLNPGEETLDEPASHVAADYSAGFRP